MLVCPDQETRDWILGLGGPLIFGGPLQPAVLGTNIASAKLHLTDAFSELQKSLKEKNCVLQSADARAWSASG